MAVQTFDNNRGPTPFRKKWALTLLLTLGSLVGNTSNAQQSGSENESGNLVQIIRENAPDYWSFSKKNAKDYLEKYLVFDGVVMGDAHPGNFQVLDLRTKLHFVNGDFDDGGQGPFALDFARLAIASKAALPDLKMATLTNAYRAGLMKRSVPTPLVIERALETSPERLRRENEELINKNTTKNYTFNYKNSKIVRIPRETAQEALKYSSLLSGIKKALPYGQALEVAIKKKHHGGSRGKLRYWVLRNSITGLEIIEFKSVQEPAVAQYKAQSPDRARFSALQKIYWENIRDMDYKLVSVNSELFWMRPKFSDLIDYEDLTIKDPVKAEDVALYTAYLLGRAHSVQPGGQRLNLAIENDPELFLESIKDFRKAYIEHLEEKFDL